MEVAMASNKKHNPPGDFAGFDTKPLDQLWKMYPKASPDKYVWIFAHTFMDARSVAMTYFKDEKGFNLGYDQVTGKVHDEGEVAIAEGSIFLRPSSSLGADVFEVSGDSNSTRARRGEGIRKRKPVALEGRREVTALPDGVQENGQGKHLSETRSPGADPPSSVQGGQGTSSSTGDPGGPLGSPPVGIAARSSGEGG